MNVLKNKGSLQSWWVVSIAQYVYIPEVLIQNLKLIIIIPEKKKVNMNLELCSTLHPIANRNIIIAVDGISRCGQ